MGAAAAVADVVVAHTQELLEVASVGTGAEASADIAADTAAIGKEVRHTCGVDRV